MNIVFNLGEIEDFVADHIQIDNHDLGNLDNFSREFKIHKTALIEGICNGISLCGGKIEGIDK